MTEVIFNFFLLSDGILVLMRLIMEAEVLALWYQLSSNILPHSFLCLVTRQHNVGTRSYTRIVRAAVVDIELTHVQVWILQRSQLRLWILQDGAWDKLIFLEVSEVKFLWTDILITRLFLYLKILRNFTVIRVAPLCLPLNTKGDCVCKLLAYWRYLFDLFNFLSFTNVILSFIFISGLIFRILPWTSAFFTDNGPHLLTLKCVLGCV